MSAGGPSGDESAVSSAKSKSKRAAHAGSATLDMASLEVLLEQPPYHGVLVLDFAQLASNTRVYKAIVKRPTARLVRCALPKPARGRRDDAVDETRLSQFVVQWARGHHQLTLGQTALQALVDLIGWNLGMLDQELAKIALFAHGDQAVDPALVETVVGGWRTETIWELVRATFNGQADVAIEQLNRLLQAGEVPQMIFGSLTWMGRRLAVASTLYLRAQASGERVTLDAACRSAGFYSPVQIREATGHLKQLRRRRVNLLLQWMVQTDLALKSTHSAGELSAWKLEQFIVRLSRQAAELSA